MKLDHCSSVKTCPQSGMASIAVITILALLLIFVMGNVRSFNALNRQLRLLEQTQRARIHMPSATMTNSHQAAGNPATTNQVK